MSTKKPSKREALLLRREARNQTGRRGRPSIASNPTEVSDPTDEPLSLVAVVRDLTTNLDAAIESLIKLRGNVADLAAISRQLLLEKERAELTAQQAMLKLTLQNQENR